MLNSRSLGISEGRCVQLVFVPFKNSDLFVFFLIVPFKKKCDFFTIENFTIENMCVFHVFFYMTF